MISKELGVSYVYLSRAFKEDLGVNYTEYINSYRIEKAKEHLKAKDMKINEVCKLIGLEPKNFHFLFKKYEHMTPYEYQRSIYNK